MQTSLPKNLNYNTVKPIGYPSHVRQEKFTPVAFNSASTSDIIRFNISTNGFWDPYSAYIKIEVDISGDNSGTPALNYNATIQGTNIPISIPNGGGLGCGSQQLDNSAHSFINQLIVWKQGSEIERIEEYDVLGAVLNDMAYNPLERGSKYFEGLGSINSLQDYQYSNPKSLVVNSMVGFSPVYPIGVMQGGLGILAAMSGGGGAYSGTLGSQWGRYESQLANNGCGETLQKASSANFLATGQNACVGSMDGQGQVNTISPKLYGFQTPFNQFLSGGSNEPLLSNNFVINSTYRGRLYYPVLKNKATFCIPLISGILGILMPCESYKYIPMKALQELILEFRLNPYAMFTSGYNDGQNAGVLTGNWFATGNTPPMTQFNQLKRIWKITKFEINVEVQYFESDVEGIILSQLNTERGIVIHINSWLLGPRYSIPALTTAMGTYQVNLGFESLKNVIFFFVPDEYQQFSFCRKQYRLSENITSMYLKIGQQYYPPLPITGHGGTPLAYNSNVDSDANNSEFLVQLYKCFGKYLDTSKECFVNPINFAINERAFDPTNTQPLNSTTFQNLDTASSAPLWHENRCVGRAIYAMNLETLNNDYSVISGINTINNRPFEIQLKSDNTFAYPRTRTMYVFCQYDMMVQLRSTGVQVLGRG